MFRTATGQTGRDAYSYEAARLANEQRELDRRFRAFVKIVREEDPGLFKYQSDFSWCGADAAPDFQEYLRARMQNTTAGGHQ